MTDQTYYRWRKEDGGLGRDQARRLKDLERENLTRIFLNSPFVDSQPGMWVLRRSIWKELRVDSSGMAFSQELKMEAYVRGFRCAETPIEYRARAGKEKLNTVRDGIGNVGHPFIKRTKVILNQPHTRTHTITILG